jgi:hypothetical protein
MNGNVKRSLSGAIALALAFCVLAPAMAGYQGTTVEVTHSGKAVGSARVIMLASDNSENYKPIVANQYGHARFIYDVTKAMLNKAGLQLCWQAYMPIAPIRSSDKICFAPASAPENVRIDIR